MWERVAGQDRAVEMLQRAAARPLHAYLLSGPPGAGVGEAAQCFAAALLCEQGGCGECRECTRVLRGRHPDVTEVEPEGSEILVGQAASVIEAAFRSPVEGARKVIVLHESERMNEAAANKLLKTFEEPPASTVFVLLTSSPDDLLDTVRSRCQSVALAAPSSEALRARRDAGPYAGVAQAFAGAPGRLDGTAGAAAVVAGEMLAAVDEALGRLGQQQQDEQDELEADLERSGYADRVAKRLRRQLADRHKRQERRGRTDALIVGLTALEETYRDALLGAAGPSVLPALDAVAALRRAVLDGIVLNWGLQLEALLVNLPGLAAPATTLADRPPG